MFENANLGLPDPMYELKKQADNDSSPEKVDLGVGVYRDKAGRCYEFDCIKKAKAKLDIEDRGHDYELTTGNERFLKCAARLLFGDQFQALPMKHLASVQTISGTGANHLGALFLRRTLLGQSLQVYIGIPAWSNYEPLFRLVGFDVANYEYYDPSKRCVNFEACLNAVTNAPAGSIFVLQGCCHNPTGADLTPAQWCKLAKEMQLRKHVPFFDVAYQGLGISLEEDAFSIRTFADMGFEMIVCQSFSKNFGLYGERVGALHVVTKSEATATQVKDSLRSLIRWEFSSSPAYGANLVRIILEDDQLRSEWSQELDMMRNGLQVNRAILYSNIISRLMTPGDWFHIMRETGLFSFLDLSPVQCEILTQKYHIYLPKNGRINITGFNPSCAERVALAIDAVVRAGLTNGDNPNNTYHE